MRVENKVIAESSDHSFEVTGLGVITALAVAFAGLVYDGTLPLSNYLVFLGFLLISASGLIWRIFNPTQARTTKSAATRP